jgi:hypothetical protein
MIELTNTRKNVWCEIKKYYICNGELYQVTVETTNKDDNNLSLMELFNKYDNIGVCAYDIETDAFEEWASIYCDTIDELPFAINNAREVSEENLDRTIELVKIAFRNKFEDFQLDGTLYSQTYCTCEQCFPPIVKPIRKLVSGHHTGNDNLSLILEVEILDGQSATTRHEFIHFIRFVKAYAPGHSLKVIESKNTYVQNVDEYFENYIDDFEEYPF